MLTTLLELQRLKRLDRTGWTLRGQMPGAETVAAHSYGVVVAAMLLADEIKHRGVDVNVERVLRLAVLHDWAEARTGDLPRAVLHYYGAETRRAAEERAFGDIVVPLGKAQAESLKRLHDEYEERATLEARLVKAADIIDLLAQGLMFERAGARGLDEFWENATTLDFKLEGAARVVVHEILIGLAEERAKLK
ncbi:MAG: HD family hydrolase [Pyrinomonadaceae bacterium]|nr:HD family hydrolase [Pyrinomonadaceae bacterium]